jgi:hypothetical protein
MVIVKEEIPSATEMALQRGCGLDVEAEIKCRRNMVASGVSGVFDNTGAKGGAHARGEDGKWGRRRFPSMSSSGDKGNGSLLKIRWK